MLLHGNRLVALAYLHCLAYRSGPCFDLGFLAGEGTALTAASLQPTSSMLLPQHSSLTNMLFRVSSVAF
jgi:hypothetical protein